jgi:hypothetical protein
VTGKVHDLLFQVGGNASLQRKKYPSLGIVTLYAVQVFFRPAGEQGKACLGHFFKIGIALREEIAAKDELAFSILVYISISLCGCSIHNQEAQQSA